MDSLLTILGYELESPFNITPEDVASIPDFQYDVARDMERTRVYHEELANQRAEIGFAKKEIRVQKDLLKPQVSLGLTAQHRMRDDFPFGSNDPATDPVGVELSYQTTLDGKKADKARLEQLKTEQEERHLSLKDSETELERRLRALARRMELLKNRIRLAEVRLEAQKRRLQATLRKYEQGDVDNLEVTRAKQDLDAAEIRLLDARIDLRLAIAEYESILPPAVPE
jgi:outer membrane protein TolC